MTKFLIETIWTVNLYFEGLKLASGLLLGLSILTIGGPVLGEMVATMAPFFIGKQEHDLLELGIIYEEVEFPTSDGLVLRGWYFPAEKDNAPAIFYAPATSHDQRSGLSLVKPLHAAGYHVLLFSYRGHGNSDGDPFGFTYGAAESKDIDAAVKYLRDIKGITKVGAIGHSAGAVSIILSAARNPGINAVVAASPFSSIDDIWQHNRPKLMPKPLYDFTMFLSELRKDFSRHQVRPIDVIDQISPTPLLLVYGSEDKRVSYEQTVQLYETANWPKQLWVIEGASHSGVRSPGLDNTAGELVDFLDDALKPRVADWSDNFGVRNLVHD